MPTDDDDDIDWAVVEAVALEAEKLRASGQWTRMARSALVNRVNDAGGDPEFLFVHPTSD